MTLEKMTSNQIAVKLSARWISAMTLVFAIECSEAEVGFHTSRSLCQFQVFIRSIRSKPKPFEGIELAVFLSVTIDCRLDFLLRARFREEAVGASLDCDPDARGGSVVASAPAMMENLPPTLLSLVLIARSRFGLSSTVAVLHLEHSSLITFSPSCFFWRRSFLVRFGCGTFT